MKMKMMIIHVRCINSWSWKNVLLKSHMRHIYDHVKQIHWYIFKLLLYIKVKWNKLFLLVLLKASTMSIEKFESNHKHKFIVTFFKENFIFHYNFFFWFQEMIYFCSCLERISNLYKKLNIAIHNLVSIY